MHESLKRISTIIRTDVLFRFRRTTAIITLLVIAAGVYLIVPEIESGRTLIQVEGRRVVYNSAAVALGTAMFCNLILSMIGYYLAGNAFRREIVSHTAFVVAATSVTNREYVVGKFFGSALYLTGIAITCMLSAMVMFLLRGERALEPFVFLTTYLWLVLPTIAFASATAILFESLPVLSGRLGDVLYFFLWAALLGTLASSMDSNAQPHWTSMFDVVGIVPIIGQMRDQFHTTSMSIGSTTFDTSRPAILFEGVQWGWNTILRRFSAFLLPVTFLLIASNIFHRFNPERIKSSVRNTKRNLLIKINIRLKPATKFLQGVNTSSNKPSTFWNAVRADVLTTLLLSPLVAVAVIVMAFLSLIMDAGAVREGLLPVIVVILVIALADIAVRDHSSGMLNLLFTSPKLQRHYVAWKFASAFLITLCFTIIPLARLLFTAPSTALSLWIGSMFLSAGAIGLGIMTRNQKPFIAIILMLLYIALNAAHEPLFDFIGSNGCATWRFQLGYGILALILLGSAQRKHAAILKSL